MLKLTKSQQKFMTNKNLLRAVIKGEQGTGKTPMAICRMLYLARHKCQYFDKILFVSPSDEQTRTVKLKFNEEYSKETISLFEMAENPVHITSMDCLIEKIYKVFSSCIVIEEVPQAILLEAITSARKAYPRVKFLNKIDETFIKEEIGWINSCGYTQFEDYAIVSRKECSIRLPKNGKGRQALWYIKENIDQALRLENKILKHVMQMNVLQKLKSNPTVVEKYTHIIVSDAQLLTKVQLQLLKVIHGGKDLLFFMDKKTSSLRTAWLKPGQTFKQVGIDMTGRVRNLRGHHKQVGKTKTLKKREVGLTPLEYFIEELLKTKEVAPKPKKRNELPWYIETYKYVNKLTGTETIFQKDTSAGETYIDEVKQEDVQALPLYASDIAAGAPIEIVEEMSDTFEMPSELLHHRRNIYMLHVQGDSMIGANINDGDYVVLQAGVVNNNEIAAVYYNGATTLKRIVQEEDHVLLISENPNYRPIVIEDGDFRVMGKLIGIIKPMSI